jgi:hypothetical protein
MQRIILLFANKAADTNILHKISRFITVSDLPLGLRNVEKKESNCHFW